MKKLISIAACFAVAFLSVSCSSDETDSNQPTKGEIAYMKFSAQGEESRLSRANFKDLQGSCTFLWEEGDKLGVYTSGSNILEELTATIVSNNKAALEGAITVGDSYIVVYPKSAVKDKGSNNNSVWITLPAEQTIPESSTLDTKYIDPNAVVQVGYTTTKAIQMLTPCSYLKFNTGSHNDIKWVKVTAYNTDDSAYGIVGDYTVTMTESNSIELGTAPSSANSVTCKYAGGTFPANSSFAIAIRPGEYGKLVVTTDTGITHTATSMESTLTHDTNTMTLARANYYSMDL